MSFIVTTFTQQLNISLRPPVRSLWFLCDVDPTRVGGLVLFVAPPLHRHWAAFQPSAPPRLGIRAEPRVLRRTQKMAQMHTTWCQILCSMRLQCVSKILTPHRMLQKTWMIAFRICMTCYGWKSTVLPSKSCFSPKNRPRKAFFDGKESRLSWLWEELYAKLLRLGQL